jgi:response regulator RpfG family c-di-GMP phosphodiesterase
MSKLLIVDDNSQNLYLLQTLLEGHGYEVVSAVNGAEALEKARQNPPDIIVSDILMPVMDGFTLCHEWKNDDYLKNIPFVFYSAEYIDEDDEYLAFKEGADRFIRKPVEPDKFIRAIRDIEESANNGRVAAREPAPETEEVRFKLYSERLIKKLEQKMTDLEREVEERKQAEEKIKFQLKRLDALRTIDMAITGNLDLHITLNILLDQITNILNISTTDVLILNPETNMLEYAAGRGFFTDALQHTHLMIGKGFAGRAALERRIITIPDINEVKDGFLQSDLLRQEKFATYVAVPLIAKNQIKGVLELFHRQPFSFDREWLNFLESLALQAAIAIDNATLFNDLQRSNTELLLAYDTTIEGWSKALDMRDKETEGHSQRVARKTMCIAREMGIRDSELVHLKRGALLHDMGKIGIPDSILYKSGPLTEEESKIMHRHPVYAYEMLSSIPFLLPALDIPYCHHEKWDGTGYPRGLKGNEIPLAARIFAVVDVWDALISDRFYRTAWPREKALGHIRVSSMTHFDPNVVEMFSKILPEIDN